MRRLVAQSAIVKFIGQSMPEASMAINYVGPINKSKSNEEYKR